MAMMKSSTSAAVVLCFTILVGMTSVGCATIFMRLPEFPEPPQIYGGVRFDISLWGDSFKGSRTFVAATIIMDFPFSLVLDTVLLPLTIPAEMYARARQREENADPED